MADQPTRYSVGVVPGAVAVQAIAFYDPNNGHIRHMHHAITLEGGRTLDGPALEREALAHAQHLGVDVSGLKRLHVPRLHDPGGRFRVDLKSQELVPLKVPPQLRVFGQPATVRA